MITHPLLQAAFPSTVKSVAINKVFHSWMHYSFLVATDARGAKEI